MHCLLLILRLCALVLLILHVILLISWLLHLRILVILVIIIVLLVMVIITNWLLMTHHLISLLIVIMWCIALSPVSLTVYVVGREFSIKIFIYLFFKVSSSIHIRVHWIKVGWSIVRVLARVIGHWIIDLES